MPTTTWHSESMGDLQVTTDDSPESKINVLVVRAESVVMRIVENGTIYVFETADGPVGYFVEG